MIDVATGEVEEGKPVEVSEAVQSAAASGKRTRLRDILKFSRVLGLGVDESSRLRRDGLLYAIFSFQNYLVGDSSIWIIQAALCFVVVLFDNYSNAGSLRVRLLLHFIFVISVSYYTFFSEFRTLSATLIVFECVYFLAMYSIRFDR